MGKINILDKYVAELIAAGEVVERPSSVVKELIENSIDAKSTSIEVEIKNGGTTLIRITDNGQGILREDVPKAFLRHATSKVKDSNDLNKIMTLGFRGEALASISAVSKVEMITRTDETIEGTHYKIEGSEEKSIEDVGCPKGTTIIVRDLFYNTPARMKFLKKDVSEANAVAAIVDRIALSHPEISFKFIRNSKEELNTPGDENIKSCIYSVYGKSFCEGLIPVEYELNNVKVRGFTCSTNSARPNRSMQHFFINGRYVKTKTASVALEQAYKGSLMVGKFPSCVIYIEISSEVVDVNVHPAKIEVRFANEKPIFDAVYHGVKTAIKSYDNQVEISLIDNTNKKAKVKNIKELEPKLNQGCMLEKIPTVNDNQDTFSGPNHNKNTNLDPDIFIPKRCTSYTPLKLNDLSNDQNIYNKKTVLKNEARMMSSEYTLQNNLPNFVPESLQEGSVEQVLNIEKIEIAKNSKEETKDLESKSNKNEEGISIFEEHDSLNIIGEAFSTYVILEKNNEKILLIDKHAAHERIIYEKLKKDSGKSFSQYLLSPVTVTLEKNEYSAVLSNLDLFKEAGFDIEDFGVGTIISRSAPLYLEYNDISNSIIEMAGYLLNNKENISIEYVDWLYHNIACRAAIKAGDKSNIEELLALVKKLEENQELRHCPHGRPIFISLTKKEIEKQFGRA